MTAVVQVSRCLLGEGLEGVPAALLPGFDGVGVHFGPNHKAPRPVSIELQSEVVKGIPVELVDRVLGAVGGLLPANRFSDAGISAWGRSLIFRVSEQDPLVLGGVSYKSIRVKGVTDHGKPPTLKPYHGSKFSSIRPGDERTEIRDGVLHVLPSLPQPSGHQFLLRAKREFTLATYLHRAGVPVPLPIGVGEYIAREFCGQRLGFIIYAQRSAQDVRLDSITNLVRLVCACRCAASILRQTHDVGAWHWNPHLGNFYHEADESVGMCDLDCGGVVDTARMSADEFDFYRFADVMSMLRNLTILHQNWEVLHRAGRASMSVDGFLRNTFIEGYLGADAMTRFPSLTRNFRADAIADIYAQSWSKEYRNGRPLIDFVESMRCTPALSLLVADWAA